MGMRPEARIWMQIAIGYISIAGFILPAYIGILYALTPNFNPLLMTLCVFLSSTPVILSQITVQAMFGMIFGVLVNLLVPFITTLVINPIW